MKQSPLFTLNWSDVLKGLLMAVLTPALFLIQQAIENGQFTFNWKQIGTAALAGGLAYIVKNFFTPMQPTKEVVKTDDGTVTKTTINTDSVKVDVNKQ